MRKRGQGLTEFACTLAVVAAALIVMSTYIKRGVQGNWNNHAVSIYPDLYDTMGSYTVNKSGNIDSVFAGFGRGSGGWIGDGHGWSIWR